MASALDQWYVGAPLIPRPRPKPPVKPTEKPIICDQCGNIVKGDKRESRSHRAWWEAKRIAHDVSTATAKAMSAAERALERVPDQAKVVAGVVAGAGVAAATLLNPAGA